MKRFFALTLTLSLLGSPLARAAENLDPNAHSYLRFVEANGTHEQLKAYVCPRSTTPVEQCTAAYNGQVFSLAQLQAQLGADLKRDGRNFNYALGAAGAGTVLGCAAGVGTGALILNAAKGSAAGLSFGWKAVGAATGAIVSGIALCGLGGLAGYTFERSNSDANPLVTDNTIHRALEDGGRVLAGSPGQLQGDLNRFLAEAAAQPAGAIAPAR